MWGWFKPRVKAQAAPGYTGAVIAGVEAAAMGAIGRPEGTAQVEAGIGLLERAMRVVRWNPEHLPPECVAMTVRRMVVAGEAVWHARPMAGGYMPSPASVVEVRGQTEDPKGWRYELQVAAPDGVMTRTRMGGQVWHFRHGLDMACPWKGVSPLARATDGNALLGRIHAALKDELGLPPTRLLPRPQNTKDDQRRELAQALPRSRGQVFPIGIAKDAGREGVERITPQPDSQVAGLRAEALRAALESIGVPCALLEPGVAGPARLNAWRQFLLATITPLCEVLKRELEYKTGGQVEYSLKALRASDIANQARAFHIFIMQEGMDETRALELAGIEEE